MSSFEEIYNQMKQHSMKVPEDRVFIKIPDAETILSNAFMYFLGKEEKSLCWQPEYVEIANWLSDNKGRGLFMYGNCGRGKSLLGRYIIPAILMKYARKVVSTFDVQEMNANLDLALSKHILSLDDIGTEEMTNTYGNKRLAFAEIMDAAEKHGKLIIISTNLQPSEIQAKYGDRVLDRIIATTKRIPFNGKSLRS